MNRCQNESDYIYTVEENRNWLSCGRMSTERSEGAAGCDKRAASTVIDYTTYMGTHGDTNSHGSSVPLQEQGTRG